MLCCHGGLQAPPCLITIELLLGIANKYLIVLSFVTSCYYQPMRHRAHGEKRAMKPFYFTLLLALLTFLNLAMATGADSAAGDANAGRPNILWIVSEDNNIQWVGCYGNPNADTPQIDALAREGFRFTHCFANVPVCGPQRCTWLTGIHAISSGTHTMRSHYDIPRDRIRFYPECLREAGYLSLNPKKTDYNLNARDTKNVWDQGKVDFAQLKNRQPFFAVVNLSDSHESQIFEGLEDTQHDPGQAVLAPYHPDLPDMRKSYARNQDAVKRMDTKLGALVDELDRAGLDENTIVIYNSDHGGVLPRSKRFLVDTGIHCPLIVRIPERFKQLYPAENPGDTVDRLVSFVDMPKTWLALTGAPIPDEMQGQIFLGPQATRSRKVHFSYRGRIDERYDNARAVRNHRYLYIRNLMPFVPRGQVLTYLWRTRAAQVWQAYHQAGKTDAVTGRFFTNKPVEELYDTATDPYSINNLAKSADHQEILRQMRLQLRDWQLQVHDAGLLPEAERVRRAGALGTTIYDMVRDSEAYPLERLLDASDLALSGTPDNRQALEQMLGDSDSGIRYWGTVGLFLLSNEAALSIPALKQALADDCHEVAAMAAWSLVRLGEKETARHALRGLLKNNSHAALYVANVIDWIDEGFDFYKEALADCSTSVQQEYLDRIKVRELEALP